MFPDSQDSEDTPITQPVRSSFCLVHVWQSVSQLGLLASTPPSWLARAGRTDWWGKVVSVSSQCQHHCTLHTGAWVLAPVKTGHLGRLTGGSRYPGQISRGKLYFWHRPSLLVVMWCNTGGSLWLLGCLAQARPRPRLCQILGNQNKNFSKII